jgi:hypothetical protein
VEAILFLSYREWKQNRKSKNPVRFTAAKMRCLRLWLEKEKALSFHSTDTEVHFLGIRGTGDVATGEGGGG